MMMYFEERIVEHQDEWHEHMRQFHTETPIGNKLEQAYGLLGVMSNLYQEIELIKSILDGAGVIAEDDGRELSPSYRVAYLVEAWHLFMEANNGNE